MKKESTSNLLDYFLFGLYLIFFTSIVFSFRAISSISIGLLLITGIIRSKRSHTPFTTGNSFSLFLVSCSLLFILQCFSLLQTRNIDEGITLLQRSSALIFIPFTIMMSCWSFNPDWFGKLIFYFAIILCIACLYCLVISTLNYFSGSAFSTLFYHDLVKPLSQHAIQFSIIIFIVLVFLVENIKQNWPSTVFMLRAMIVFLSFFLILLSSKLIICFYIFYLLWFFLHKKFYKPGNIVFVLVFIAATSILLSTPNPVGNRFRSMFAGNSLLFAQKKFDPGIYFNGLQFRLLQWRFTYEILNEQHAWLIGLTPGDAQSFLDKKYIETNMYTGVPGTGNHGFLGYHTHNQFLQIMLENGLLGLVVFLTICFSLLKMAGGNNQTELKWLVVLLLVYCFTDAPLATQYGLVIFLFLPSFFYWGKTGAAGQKNLVVESSHPGKNSAAVETMIKAT